MDLQVEDSVIREDNNGRKTVSYVFRPVAASTGGEG